MDSSHEPPLGAVSDPRIRLPDFRSSCFSTKPSLIRWLFGVTCPSSFDTTGFERFGVKPRPDPMSRDDVETQLTQASLACLFDRDASFDVAQLLQPSESDELRLTPDALHLGGSIAKAVRRYRPEYSSGGYHRVTQPSDLPDNWRPHALAADTDHARQPVMLSLLSALRVWGQPRDQSADVTGLLSGDTQDEDQENL